jgi:hypothetical protein
MEQRTTRLTVSAVALALSFSLGCSLGAPTADCVTDGGAIQRAPRESPFSAGGGTIVVSEKYCMSFNDYSFKETVISVKSAKKGAPESERVVHCKRIRIDHISKRAPGVTEFRSDRITKPLLYNEAKGVFGNQDSWDCDF